MIQNKHTQVEKSFLKCVEIAQNG
jgi:hypothetical protein